MRKKKSCRLCSFKRAVVVFRAIRGESPWLGDECMKRDFIIGHCATLAAFRGRTTHTSPSSQHWWASSIITIKGVPHNSAASLDENERPRRGRARANKIIGNEKERHFRKKANRINLVLSHSRSSPLPFLARSRIPTCQIGRGRAQYRNLYYCCSRALLRIDRFSLSLSHN